MSRHVLLLCFLLLFPYSPSSDAQERVYLSAQTVTVCDSDSEEVPEFTEENCRDTDLYDIRLYKRSLWLKTEILISDKLLVDNLPLGVFVSASMAHRLYWDGELLGENGRPSGPENDEIAGKMDVVYFLPYALAATGKHEIVLKVSGHHSLLPLAYPFHYLGVGHYKVPMDIAQEIYFPSFLPFALLLTGTLYFTFLAYQRGSSWNAYMLPLASLFATLQLVFEVVRAFWQYDYPVHEIRLIMVTVCSAATALCLVNHVANAFLLSRRPIVVLLCSVLVLSPVYLENTFTERASLVMLVGALCATLITFYGAVVKKPGALAYVAVLTAFSLIIFLAPSDFLDIYYFYCVAGLMLFLFWRRALEAEQERKMLNAEQARAEKLQSILDAREERKSATRIKVTEQSGTHFIPADEVLYVKAAGDYVELYLKQGECRLHTARLVEMERTLPTTFLRVHRSYLVNTDFISGIKREASGRGHLLLSSGDKVPVSRRIMPKVREAIS